MGIEVCQRFDIIFVMPIPASVKYIFFSALFALAAINFTRTTLNIIQSSKRLDRLRDEVVSLEEEKVSLEEDLEYRKSTYYIEMEARNKLNLIKPGEYVYISPVVLSEFSERALSENHDAKVFSNSRQWLELFF